MAPPNLSLPIEKYSWTAPTQNATAVSGEIRWNHLGEHGLVFVVAHEAFGVTIPGVCMKMMKQAQVMEFVQLEALCIQSQCNLSQGAALDLPISAVTRSPRLALTYRDSQGMYRRFQIRFRHVADYEAIVGVLTELKCPNKDAQDQSQTVQKLRRNITEPITTTMQQRPFSVLSEAPSSQGYTMPFQAQRPNHRPASALDRLRGTDVDSSRQSSASDFPVPQFLSQASRDQRSVSRPSSSLDLPPLPTPTFAHQTDHTLGSQSGSSTSQRGGQLADMQGPQSTPCIGMPTGSQSVCTIVPTNGELRQTTPQRTPLATLPNITNLPVHNQRPAGKSMMSDSSQRKALEDYAAQPDSAKQKVVDDMICEHLLDDGFLSLCQSVNYAWRRIGFEWNE